MIFMRGLFLMEGRHLVPGSTSCASIWDFQPFSHQMQLDFYFFFCVCDLQQQVNCQSCRQKTCVKVTFNTNPNKINLCSKQIQSNRLHVRGSRNTDSEDYCHTPQASCATFTKWPKLFLTMIHTTGPPWKSAPCMFLRPGIP